MKKYIRINQVPLLIHLIFIISLFLIPRELALYSNFLFYSLLLLYFIVRKEFSIQEWFKNLKKGKEFWLPVLFTSLGFILAFGITIFLENSFPSFNAGMIGLKRDTWFRLIIFAISTIILPPITEELFYRKSLIDYRNNKWMIITTSISILLYASEHSLSPWGILLTSIWAIPLSISYIKTKNVYVPMTAHFIGNLLGNGTDIIFTTLMLL